jgi:hypothetical protein
MTRIYYLVFCLILVGVFVLSCCDDECELENQIIAQEPATAPMASIVVPDACSCSWDDIATYDVRIDPNCPTGNHHLDMMREQIEQELRDCLDEVSREASTLLYSRCLKIKQLCREAERLLMERIGCQAEAAEKLEFYTKAAFQCSDPLCLAIYKALMEKERRKLIECTTYYINAGRAKYLEAETLYASFPAEEAYYEELANDCIKQARARYEEENIDCVDIALAIIKD